MTEKAEVITCATLAADIATDLQTMTKSETSRNLLYAQYAAMAVSGGFKRKASFDQLATAIGETAESEIQLKFAKRRVGMGFRVLIGGTGGKAPHKNHATILKIWIKGETKKGYGLKSCYDEVVGTRNKATIQTRLKKVLEEFKTEGKAIEAANIFAEVLGEVLAVEEVTAN